MKVAHAEKVVLDSQGLGKAASFTIRPSAHAFKILSSGLYADKVRAVLREVGCNAADAHIEQGTPDRPILVKLPNQLDTQFFIQDWGPGLSHESVTGLYSTYFASTKQESNDFTGAFGLGSKSPFAYTDSFAVVSTHGGRKRTYAVFVDNKGTPGTSLMSEEDPEPGWEHGLRVGFPVRVSDVAEFAKKAQLVFRWFAVLPTVKGGEPIVAPKVKVAGDSYRLQEAGSHEHPLTVKMGNVIYPLDAAKLAIKSPLSDTDKFVADGDFAYFATKMTGLLLEFPMGALQIAASREALQYDPDTAKALKDKMREAAQEVAASTTKLVRDMSSLQWIELCKRVAELKLHTKDNYDFSVHSLILAHTKDQKFAERCRSLLYSDSVEIPKHAGTDTGLFFVYKDRKGDPRTQGIKDGHGVFNSQAMIPLHEGSAVVLGMYPGALFRARAAVKSGQYHQLLVLTRGPDKATDATMVSAANKLRHDLNSMHLIEQDALPDVYLPPKKRPRKDGKLDVAAILAASPPVAIFGEDTGSVKLSACPPVFVCVENRSSWGRSSSKVRVLRGQKDSDSRMEIRSAENAWSRFCALLSRAGMKPSVLPQLGAAQILQLGLVKAGWVNFVDHMSATLADPRIAATVEKACASWTPSAPEYLHYTQSWAAVLAHLLRYKPEHCDVVLREKLAKTQAGKYILAIGKNTRKSHNMPEEAAMLSEVQQFCSQYGAPAQVKAIVRANMVPPIEAVDEMFLKEHPRLEFCEARTFGEAVVESDGERRKALQFLMHNMT